MLLALILQCNQERLEWQKENKEEKTLYGQRQQQSTNEERMVPNHYHYGPTLIVTPLSLLSQWKEEIETKTNLSYMVCYNGDSSLLLSSKKTMSSHMQQHNIQPPQDMNHVHVVLTTYGTMQVEYQKQQQQNNKKKQKDESSHGRSFLSLSSSSSSYYYGILDQSFLRCILDEGHVIKNPNTIVAKACCTIKAYYRWIVTGTIIHNNLNDVYSLLRFLQHEPWCETRFWKMAINNTNNNNEMNQTHYNNNNNENDHNHNNNNKDEQNEKQTKADQGGTIHDESSTGSMMVALGRVRRLLNPLMLRRTKDSLTANG